MAEHIMHRGETVHTHGDLTVIVFNEDGDVEPGIGTDFLLPREDWLEMGSPERLTLKVEVA